MKSSDEISETLLQTCDESTSFRFLETGLMHAAIERPYLFDIGTSSSKILIRGILFLNFIATSYLAIKSFPNKGVDKVK